MSMVVRGPGIWYPHSGIPTFVAFDARWSLLRLSSLPTSSMNLAERGRHRILMLSRSLYVASANPHSVKDTLDVFVESLGLGATSSP